MIFKIETSKSIRTGYLKRTILGGKGGAIRRKT